MQALKCFCGVALFAVSAGAGETVLPGDWPVHQRDSWGSRYSPLTDITKDNVGKLERAWTYRTGDILGRGDRDVFECTPLAIDGVVYLVTPFQRAVALDGATGRELWSYDPKFDVRGSGGLLASRGVAYWTDGEKRRIILPVRDGRVIFLDAAIGKPDPAFGKNGVVHLKELFAPAGKDIILSSPPAIYNDLIIQGCSLPDGSRKVGHIPVVALNARTGEIAWTFNTVPQEGEPGTETWENESWKGRGGNNVWSLISVDHERGLVYLPVSTPNYDFYGGDRPGENLYSDSVVCLNARTGAYVWHFQTVHHDLWDYDLPAQPNLVDLTVYGEKIPAVAQIGKTGFVYVLHRLTGAPVFPIEERPVPASDVPGEKAWPTQPFPAKPPAFSKQGLAEEDLGRLDEESHAELVKKFRELRSEGIFTPPSLRGSIVMPGFHGGGNWSGAAVDLEKGVMYVNSTEMACYVQLKETPRGDFAYTHTGWIRFRDRNGYPANAPPWGLLSAIDLNRGEVLWQAPLGEFEELTARGVPITGQENFGGATVTASGLVFIASTMDERIRAFDADTGSVLWSAKLDAAGYAAPITYRGGDGRQYVLICAGGGGKLQTRVSDAVIAFALPVE